MSFEDRSETMSRRISILKPNFNSMLLVSYWFHTVNYTQEPLNLRVLSSSKAIHLDPPKEFGNNRPTLMCSKSSHLYYTFIASSAWQYLDWHACCRMIRASWTAVGAAVLDKPQNRHRAKQSFEAWAQNKTKNHKCRHMYNIILHCFNCFMIFHDIYCPWLGFLFNIHEYSWNTGATSILQIPNCAFS